MYKVETSKWFEKNLRKLSSGLQDLVLDKHLPILQKNPYCGKPLKRNLKGLYKYSFNFKGTSYRIIYKILDQEKTILLVMVGPRENIYKILKRRIK